MDKVTTLGSFMDFFVHKYRKLWQAADHKELWFRGESKDYPDSPLRPELYRLRRPGCPIQQIDALLDIENRLYEEFQRCAEQFRSELIDPEYWDWDSYFLLQHHGGATRLLDWSDGALMALHFAVRYAKDDYPKDDDEKKADDAFVYVLEPDRLKERLESLHKDTGIAEKWREYVRDKKRGQDYNEEAWEDAYIPRNKEERAEFAIPNLPLVLDFPNINRRVAAQRGRFIVFGTDYEFLSDEFKREESSIKRICIDGSSRRSIRRQLRDAGITESVIYPDLDGVGREMKQLWEEQK